MIYFSTIIKLLTNFNLYNAKMVKENLFYENKLRTRVSGLCFKNNKILLVKHVLKGKVFYAPPGGAVEFGETMEEALKREISEETNIEIMSSKFQFITEFIRAPLHAIEIFYYVESWKGLINIGTDPESEKNTIIQDVGFYSSDEINQLKSDELHHILRQSNNPFDLLKLSGFIQP